MSLMMNTEIILSFVLGTLLGGFITLTLSPKLLRSIFRDTARTELSELQSELTEKQINQEQDIEKLITELNKEIVKATTTWNISSQNLATELKELSESHSKWAQALSNTSEQGALAEESLKVMLETAGFVKGVNFDEQVTEKTTNGNLRPDVYVYTADGGTIIIDSKAPMKLYREAIESNDKDITKKKLKQHAKSVLSYAKELGKKDYSSHSLHKNTTDFVIMFLPNVSVYMSAVEQIPDLVEQAAKHRVMICPPSLVYAALKTIMLTWQQQEVYKNAESITDQAVEIHRRLNKFYNDYFEKIGLNLGRAIDAYNMSVRSFNHRLIPSLRKMESMGIADQSRKIERIDPLDNEPIASKNDEEKLKH